MSKIVPHQSLRVPDPFDASTQARLKNMGVHNSDGGIHTQTMGAFSKIFTGLFFDDLCDNYNAEDMLAIFEAFKALSQKEDYHHMYLLMSIHYDYMKKTLPDPVWWLAGDSGAVMAFMSMFIKGYERLMISEGFIKANEGVNSE